MPNEELVADQRLRSEALLRGLEGELMDAVTLRSTGSGEAGFLSGIVSKLSPLIANRLEKQICDMLNTGDEGSHRWIRQDPDFPDVLLLDEDGKSTGGAIGIFLASGTRAPGPVTVSKNPQTPFDEGLRAYERSAGVALPVLLRLNRGILGRRLGLQRHPMPSTTS